MGKPVSTDQSHAVIAALATNVDWNALDAEVLQEIVRVPKDAGKQFTAFLKNGGKMGIGEHTIITSCSMVIDYDRSVKDGIKAGSYDWKNDDITSEHFPSQEAGTKEATVDLFHYGKDMSTDEVLADLDKQGYRPATLKELLALGEKHPDLQREFPIIALGSVWRRPDGRVCPYLDRDGSERGLSLRWIDRRWDDDCRFAAVRK